MDETKRKELTAIRRAARFADEFNEGFDYAAGKLLRGALITELEKELTGEQSESEWLAALALNYNNGVRAAIEKWVDLFGLKEIA